MAAGTAEFAFLVDEFVAATRTKTPMLAGNIFAGWNWAGFFNFRF
jgi:hypothetical protein